MKVYRCKNKDCVTDYPCILYCDSKAVIPQLCPFDIDPQPAKLHQEQERLVPDWQEAKHEPK